ncbi:phosphoribosylformylglycinamidine cyclo-ligase [Fructobacillus pseudoficulneus]|uniref:Phosphoribosylformylglycinamidine cyclo-ligase n=1 Tax=Fructobacillus pseudoficulneus TaxID=220714 RepID=A0A3F3GZ33_9LACO|nr:phosphoribosylformylglycinamidine cyclo-ligase [Fructobacillus pseudoficulneus]GAP03267.1 phosphoribosylformylglycinamidine cyclo-ligase [Fructobacillus pseudoficulneus]SEH43143.1 phosphoribosylformylglycinamidine cyclo-ligase [Fructobacillus pseudoficulneus]
MAKKQNAYEAAGVDIEAGNQAVELMSAAVQETYTPNVLSGLGGFGSVYALDAGLKEPVLISGTDGVGTKLLLAIAANRHNTIGQDLVGMVVNDILAQGAKPAFMLDYLAVDKMRPAVAAEIVTGIAKAAKEAQIALVGGESAELPGLYQPHHYDLAAFAVGVAEKSQLLKADDVQVGDVLIGLPSSGVHSNGYSLVRQVLGIHDDANAFNDLPDYLQEEVLAPTKLYTHALWPLIQKGLVHSAAHITGGGLVENLPRALPANVQAEIKWGTWPILPIFKKLQEAGQLSVDDMLLTFNNGLGMVLTVSADQADAILDLLAENDEPAYKIGEIVAAGPGDEAVTFTGDAPWPAK